MSIIKQDYGALSADVQTQMLIAPVLPSMISDRAYAVGEQFIVDSVLYKITQTVSAAGVALVVGNNCAVSDSITQQMRGVLKTTTFSGTTDNTGNFAIAPLTTGVVVSIRETHNYLPIFMITSGNNNYVKFINVSASTFQPIINAPVSGEYYYIELD